MISIVVALSKNNVIGKDAKMPWDLRSDMEFFKSLTMNNIVIMGQKTYESIGCPLIKRINIVISRNIDTEDKNRSSDINNKSEKTKLYYKASIEDALKFAQELSEENEDKKEIFIIGGETIYKQTIDNVDRLYITEIDEYFEGDKFFPEFDKSKYKKEVLNEIQEPITHRFIMYTKKEIGNYTNTIIH